MSSPNATSPADRTSRPSARRVSDHPRRSTKAGSRARTRASTPSRRSAALRRSSLQASPQAGRRPFQPGAGQPLGRPTRARQPLRVRREPPVGALHCTTARPGGVRGGPISAQSGRVQGSSGVMHDRRGHLIEPAEPIVDPLDYGSGCGSGRGTGGVGNLVSHAAVGLMADAGDHRPRACRHRLGHRLLIEGRQIGGAAPSPGEHHHVAIPSGHRQPRR